MANATLPAECQDTTDSIPSSEGYGRARLWLGITAVGTLVTLATLGLALDVPGLSGPITDVSMTAQLISLFVYVLIYALVQLRFDLLGGYFLPKRFGRFHPPLARYLVGLIRGIAVHATLLWLAAVAIMFAGRYGGIPATVAVGMGMSLLLLIGRMSIASLVAPLQWTTTPPADDRLPMVLARSSDEGFTGGVIGVFRARLHILPVKWQEVLGPERFEFAVARRLLAVTTGSWWRGRFLSLVFTLTGFVVVAFLIGSERLGSASGTIEFSLWFSLWSFIGLLILPTLSRRGVMEIDDRALQNGMSREMMQITTLLLDRLQDSEPKRGALIETIFHPIPSVRNRLDSSAKQSVVGYWDVARTSVYLSLSGLSLLGRAVHCNCGRPSLWVMLPTD